MTGQMPSDEPIDLFDHSYHQNPYVKLSEVRKSQGYYRSEVWRGVMLLKHCDVETALRSQALSLGNGVAALFDQLDEAQRTELQPLIDHVSMWLGTLPTDDHAKLRKRLNSAFSRTVIESLRPEIQKIADQLLSKMSHQKQVDIVDQLAAPLPALTIAMLLGTPIEDRQKFQKWSSDLSDFLGFGMHDIDTMRQAQKSVLEMTAYLRELIRKTEKPTGLLARLLEAQRSGYMSEESLLANCVLLMFAGYETTTLLISNCLFALLSHPDQLQMVKRDSALLENAIDETLRYEAPVMMVRRVAVEDVTIGEANIKSGEFVWLVLGSANHDDSKYDKPDEFNIMRQNISHLAFGSGVHYCLGAALSKIEAEVAISTLLEMFPNITSCGPTPQWAPIPVARRLQHLQVEVCQRVQRKERLEA